MVALDGAGGGIMAKVEIFNGIWTRQEVSLDNTRVYLFGDNLADAAAVYVPSSTQAVIRGLSNAIGIPTKKGRGHTDNNYFWDTDKDFALFKSECDKAINRVIDRGMTVVLPSGGIGTGKAAIKGAFKAKGNRFRKYLDKSLESLNSTPPSLVSDKVQEVIDGLYRNGTMALLERAGVVTESIRYKDGALYHWKAGECQYLISEKTLRKLVAERLP